MWTALADAASASASGGSDNFWTVLGIVAGGLVTIAVLLLTSRRRQHPEVEPEPVARRVVGSVETYLQQQIRKLERQLVEKERQLHDERVAAEHKLEEERAKTVGLIRSLATCQAERTELMYRLRNPDGTDD